MTDFPYLFHPSIGVHELTIRDALSFKAAKVFWDAIAEIYQPVTKPQVKLEREGPVQVKPALVTEQKRARKPFPKGTGTQKKCPYCEHVCNSHALHLHVKNKHSEKYEEYKSTTKPFTKSTKLVVAPTVDWKDIVHESTQDKLKKLVVLKNGNLAVGDKVKYNGSHSSPFTGKIGHIEKIGTKDQILVKFGENSSWLSKDIVVVVPAVES